MTTNPNEDFIIPMPQATRTKVVETDDSNARVGPMLFQFRDTGDIN